MNSGTKSLVILMGVIAGLCGLVTFYPALSGVAIVQYDLTLDDVVKLMTNLFFIALLMERFMEVFVTVIRQGGKVPLEIRCSAAKKSLVMIEGHVSDMNDVRKDAQAVYQDSLLVLEAYRFETRRITLLASFCFGIAIGLAGVHVLQTIYDIDDLVGFQRILFVSIDVALTAGIIAGGSKGINGITRVFGDFFETRRTILNNIK